MLRALGDLAGARAAYETKRAIIGRLAAADPGNRGWQYDLGTSHARIGFVLEAQGDFAAALAEYEACLAIVRRFAAADPDNAGSQRDLAVSHGKLAANYHRLGKTAPGAGRAARGTRHHGGAGQGRARGRAMGRASSGASTPASPRCKASGPATAPRALTIASVTDPLAAGGSEDLRGRRRSR